MARAILNHKDNWLPCIWVGNTRRDPLAQCSTHHISKTIQKARWTTRHWRRWGRGLGSHRNRKLQNCERRCTIPSAIGRPHSMWRHIGNHRPPVQLSRQPQRVMAEVLLEATRWKTGLTMTSGKPLPIESPRNGAVIWYLVCFLLVAFSSGFLVRHLVFNGHGMHM